MNTNSLKSKRILLYAILILLFISDVIAYYMFVNAAQANYSVLSIDKYEVLENLVNYVHVRNVIYKSFGLTVKSDEGEIRKMLGLAEAESYFISTNKNIPIITSGEYADNSAVASLFRNVGKNDLKRYYMKNRDIYVYSEEDERNRLYIVLSFSTNVSEMNNILKLFIIYKSFFLFFLFLIGIFLLYSIEQPIRKMAVSAGRAGININPDEPDRLYSLFRESLDSIKREYESESKMSQEIKNRFMKMEKSILELRSLEELSSITDGIAHQLNNNLASIKGNVQLYSRNQDAETLKRIEDDIEAMISFTRRFLEFSQTISTFKESVNIGEIVNEIAQRFPGKIKLDFDQAMPEAYTDRVLLEQAVMNFTDNAIKYSGSELIEISLVEIPRFIRLTIRDYGKGMPQSVIDLPYRPFSPEAKGYGLGIPTALKILGLLGHKTEIRNCEPGSSVTIDIGKEE